jgi:hypothetical protein
VRGPELISEVDVARDGLLVDAAVGWSRTPLQRVDLRGARARHKRWEHWAVLSDELLLMITLVDIGPLSLAIIACCDLATRRWTETIRPLRSLDFPARVHGADIRVSSVGLHVAILARGDKTLIELRARPLLGPKISAELEIDRKNHETLNVVVPFSHERFAFTSKQPGLPVRGRVTAGRSYEVNAFATLDHGRGVWPRDTRWNWASASSARVAFNLGAQWTDGSGTNENGYFVDGKLHSLSEDVRFDLDRGIVGPTVDLAFTTLVRKRTLIPLGLAHADLDFRVGRFNGRIGDVRVDNLLGWAEDFNARW